jgi:hypothetical protein
MSCYLSWLFGPSIGPRTIRLIDSHPEYRKELEAFAGGAYFDFKGLRFQTYITEEVDAYHDLFSLSMAANDPVVTSFGITHAEFKQHTLGEMFGLTDFMPYSVCAKAEGELVGCALSYSQVSEPTAPRFLTPNSESIWETKLDKYEKLFEESYPFELCYPDSSGRLPPNSIDIRTVLHLFGVAVTERFRGNNYCYDLLLLSAALGYLRGLSFSVAECTNPRSSHFYKIGGFTCKPFLYKEFQYKGDRPLADVEDGIRIALLSV